MTKSCSCSRIDGYRIRRKTCPAHGIPTTSEGDPGPRPAPALTDEQLECRLREARLRYGDGHGGIPAWREFDALIASIEARAARRERERMAVSGVLHVWGFLSGDDRLVSEVSVALCPGRLHDVADHVISDARECGYDVSMQTVRGLDGYLREVHAVWAVDPDAPMWHRFVRPSAPWVKEVADDHQH